MSNETSIAPGLAVGMVAVCGNTILVVNVNRHATHVILPLTPPQAPPPEYDPDAFDSMAVINAEEWNEGGPDEGGLTRSDLLPQVCT